MIKKQMLAFHKECLERSEVSREYQVYGKYIITLLQFLNLHMHIYILYVCTTVDI